MFPTEKRGAQDSLRNYFRYPVSGNLLELLQEIGLVVVFFKP